MVNIRKLVTIVEEILTDGGRPARRPVRKAAAVAVIENPFAGRFVEDLTPLIDAGESGEKRERLEPRARVRGGRQEEVVDRYRAVEAEVLRAAKVAPHLLERRRPRSERERRDAEPVPHRRPSSFFASSFVRPPTRA